MRNLIIIGRIKGLQLLPGNLQVIFKEENEYPEGEVVIDIKEDDDENIICQGQVIRWGSNQAGIQSDFVSRWL